jgi:hypothetical protein
MSRKRCPANILAMAAIACVLGCANAPAADPRMVSAWMQTLYGAIRVERVSPPVASRLMGYATSALYSGLAVSTPGMPPLSGVINGLQALPQPVSGEQYDATLTAVAAERVVLDSLLREALPTTRAAVGRLADSLERARMSLGIAAETGVASKDLGRRIGLAIVAWSRSDGFDSTRGRKYLPPSGVGLWINDAPGSIYAAQNQSGVSSFVALDNPANVLQNGNASDRSLILNRPKRAGLATLPPVNMSGASEPYWAQVRPFVLESWDACSVPGPPPFSTDTGSPFYKEAEEVRSAQSKLTPEQRTTAFYWADNAGESGTPVGHWISIAAQIVSERHLSAADAARLMVMTAAAQADAFIASWGYKYRYNLTRPRTYIRATIDSTWEPLIPTPPFPEYPSGHSTQSAAAAAVLTAVVGDAPFDDSTSVSIGHSVRRFPSFNAAAEEAGMSRIFAGIHFPSGNVDGRTLGYCIGGKVVERFKALRTP